MTLPPNMVVTVETSPESLLRRVLRQTRLVLPFPVNLATPDDVHLEVTMYVLDRDYHLRVGEQTRREDKPYIRHVFSFDMSDEAVALRQERVIAAEDRRPTDDEVDRMMRSEITDDEMAKLVLGCVAQAVTHEVREGFYHQGRRVDDPHAGPEHVKRDRVP